MILHYKTVDKNYRYFGQVKHLYEHAFPSEERPSFSMLLSLDNNKLYGVEEFGKLVGLVSVVECEDLLYIFFLAIKKSLREHGYGSKILVDILDEYQDKRVFLLAEDPSIPCPNKEERNKRINFYNHNGLYQNDVTIVEYGVQYVLLSNDRTVNKNDFLKVMEVVAGDFYPIYVSNVK